MIEEDVRFRHLEKKIGVFVVIALAGLAAVIFFIGMENDLFTQKYTLRFTVERGTGFSRGMPVKLSGFRIGRIGAIALNDQAMVNIDIQIDKKYQKWIRRDSTVRLTKEGLVGDTIIEVSVGSTRSEILRDGDPITFVKTKGLEEVANELADKVKPVLSEVRDIISYINDPDGDIKQSLKNIHAFTAGLNETRSRADRLLVRTGNDMHGVSDTAVKLLDNANANIIRLQPSLEKVDATLGKLPPILDKVSSTLENVEKTTAEIRKTSEKTLPRIPPLVRRTEDVLQGADTTINAIQGIWPIRSHIPSGGSTDVLPGDSHD